ncbi:DUF6343 family protein [Streptomyces sp. NBC_01506]|uniref:DUF6343 family protein n=1 Tax=Streptomyces sp. NBC_01506 TaxID=2903887 RepID=UPI00386AED21
MRTGNEPVTARSALRMRWWLSLWGLIWTGFGTAAFAIAGRPGWAIGCGVLLLIVATDFVVVLHHKRQGSRYQPGPDVPPYEDHSHDHSHRNAGTDSDSDTGTGTGTGDQNGSDASDVSRRSRSARL